MKKVFIVLLALVLALSCGVACAEPADLASYAGVWRPLWVDSGYGPTENEGILGGEIVINEDGTGSFCLDMDDEPWEAQNMRTELVNGLNYVIFSVDADGEMVGMNLIEDPEYYPGLGKTLVMPAGEKLYVYSQDYELVEELPAERTDVAIEDFEGAWMMRECYFEGRRLGFECYSSLIDPNTVCEIDTEKLTSQLPLITTTLSIKFYPELADGALAGEVSENPEVGLRYTLLEDGTMKMEFAGCEYIFVHGTLYKVEE